MIPVYQTTFGGKDSPPEEMGNCYSACVASIMELLITAVPNFHVLCREQKKQWYEVQADWFRLHGLWVFSALWSQEWEEGAAQIGVGYYMLDGRSPRGEWNHSVVALAGKIVHDPASERYPQDPPLLRHTTKHPWSIEVLVPFTYPRRAI